MKIHSITLATFIFHIELNSCWPKVAISEIQNQSRKISTKRNEKNPIQVCDPSMVSSQHIKYNTNANIKQEIITLHLFTFLPVHLLLLGMYCVY